MKRELLTGIGMLLVASSVAFAQTAPATPTVPGYPDTKVIPVDNSPVKTPATGTQANGTQANGASLRQTLSSNMEKAGYTDVKIKPDAYIVEAKNKSGDPVMMFLTPDSMTVFTARDAKGQDTAAAPANTPAN
jgi:hypothetical protein